MKHGVTGADASEQIPVLVDASGPPVEIQVGADVSADGEVTTSLRARCHCGAWHAGRHVVDGIEVASVYCRQHTIDAQRLRWAMDNEEQELRPVSMRFRPHNVPKAHKPWLVKSLLARTDLLDPPADEPVVEPIRTGDARIDTIPLKEIL